MIPVSRPSRKKRSAGCGRCSMATRKRCAGSVPPCRKRSPNPDCVTCSWRSRVTTASRAGARCALRSTIRRGGYRESRRGPTATRSRSRRGRPQRRSAGPRAAAVSRLRAAARRRSARARTRASAAGEWCGCERAFRGRLGQSVHRLSRSDRTRRGRSAAASARRRARAALARAGRRSVRYASVVQYFDHTRRHRVAAKIRAVERRCRTDRAGQKAFPQRAEADAEFFECWKRGDGRNAVRAPNRLRAGFGQTRSARLCRRQSTLTRRLRLHRPARSDRHDAVRTDRCDRSGAVCVTLRPRL